MLKNFKALKKGQENDPEKDLENMSDEEFDNYLSNAYDNDAYEDTEQPETEEAAEEAAENEDGSEDDAPYKSFATEEDYNKALNDYVNAKYGKELIDNRSKAETLRQIEELARSYYGDSDNALQALLDDLEQQNASNRGVDVDTYRQNEADRRDLETYRSQQKAEQEARDGRQRIIDQWNSDTERLKQTVPEFDLEQAMQNEEFRNAVINGASVPEAYYSIKYRELQPQPRDGIRQNALSRGTRSGGGLNDMMSMNDKDFRSQLKKIMNNE
jgi:hypothetical protein